MDAFAKYLKGLYSGAFDAFGVPEALLHERSNDMEKREVRVGDRVRFLRRDAAGPREEGEVCDVVYHDGRRALRSADGRITDSHGWSVLHGWVEFISDAPYPEEKPAVHPLVGTKWKRTQYPDVQCITIQGIEDGRYALRFEYSDGKTRGRVLWGRDCFDTEEGRRREGLIPFSDAKEDGRNVFPCPGCGHSCKVGEIHGCKSEPTYQTPAQIQAKLVAKEQETRKRLLREQIEADGGTLCLDCQTRAVTMRYSNRCGECYFAHSPRQVDRDGAPKLRVQPEPWRPSVTEADCLGVDV